jgi:hypothetical protein
MSEQKTKRFNIKNYSKKIQRKYARAKAFGETLAEHYKKALQSYQENRKAGGYGQIGFDSSSYLRTFKQVMGQPAPAYKTSYQKKIDQFCTNGAFSNPPTADTDWTGIELEVCIDAAKLPQKLLETHGFFEARQLTGGEGEKLARNILGHFLKNERVFFFHTKMDGSIRKPKDDTGARQWIPVEITIMSRAGTEMNNIKTLCNALKKLDARLNRSSGMHLHLDCRHMNDTKAEQVGERLLRALPLLAAMQHPLRRENSYCKMTKNNITDSRDSRYCAINMYSMRERRTIEIRLHSGTTSADKIIHWAKLLHAIKETDFDGFLLEPKDAILKLPMLTSSTAEYIKARVDLFSGSLGEIAKKNKCTVPFVDEDTEEVRLADVANHDLLERVINELKKCENWKDVNNFAKEQQKHAAALSEELGTKHGLLYMDLIDSMIEQAKERTKYEESRANEVKQAFTREIVNAAKVEDIKAIRKKLELAVNLSSLEPDYMSYDDYVLLTAQATARENELKTPPVKEGKVFDFGAALAATKRETAAPEVAAQAVGLELNISPELRELLRTPLINFETDFYIPIPVPVSRQAERRPAPHQAAETPSPLFI